MRRIPVLCCALIGLASLAATSASSAQTGPAEQKPDASGPQTGTPTPLPRGQSDIPGGTSHDGVVKPPATASGAMSTIPPPQQGVMPVVPPPGTGGNQPDVQPK